MNAEPIQPVATGHLTADTPAPDHSAYVVGYAALTVIALALVGLACVAAAVFDQVGVW